MTEKSVKIPWQINREKTALLVIDMQNDFLKPGGVLYFSELPMNAVPNIQKLIYKCRSLKIPVVFVSDANGAIGVDAHNATLKNIQPFFGRVLDTSGLINALEFGEKESIPFIG